MSACLWKSRFFVKNQFFLLKTFSIPIVKNKRLFDDKQVFFNYKLLSTEEELIALQWSFATTLFFFSEHLALKDIMKINNYIRTRGSRTKSVCFFYCNHWWWTCETYAGLKESLGVEFEHDKYAELCLKFWSENDWYFCNITESGWFAKRLSRNKVSNNHFRKSA